MASRGSSALLERQRLLDYLSTPAQFVALLSPIGAGATTLLRQWATQHANVAWGTAGSIPDALGDVLIIDDAGDLTAEDWSRVRAMRVARPQLLIRAAVHSASAVPAGIDVEFVSGLSFTLQETTEYLSAMSSNLTPSTVHLMTGGLPAAVRAVAHLKTVKTAFVTEALARLRPGALPPQHATLALPEVLTEELVRELGGPADFIEQSERAGLGEWMPDAGHPLFVLTAPVRAATLQAYSDDPQPVRERAGQVLLAQGAWSGALREGAAMGSLAVVDAALKGGGMTLLRAHGHSITASIRDVRLLEMRRWPVVAMAQALSFNARQEHRVRAVELMGIALLGARSAPAASAERALLCVIESVAQRLLGLGDGGSKAARKAARILDELPVEESQSIAGLLSDLHTHSAISLMYGGQDDDALAQFEHALAAPGRPGLELISLGGIAMIHALSGDLIAAQSWIDTALKRPWPDALMNEYQGSLLRIAQAKIFVEHGDPDSAKAALDGVWHIIDTIEHWPALAHLRAMIDLCLGQPEAGLERLRALRRRRGSRMPRSQARLLDLTESSLALAAGDLVSARTLTPRAGDLSLVALGAIRMELFDGNYERALRMLGTISAEGPEARATLAVLEAITLRRLDRHTDASVAASRARTIADTYGLTTPFVLVPAEDRELFGPVADWKGPALTIGAAVPRLTVRERVILRELLETANLNDIALRLHVSVNTVKSQRRSLYRKLGAGSREEALAAAVGHGLLSEAARSSR